MSGLPRVVIDVDSCSVFIDGQPFPWSYAGVEPTIAEGPDGTVYPGVTITLACSDLQITKPSEVISDEQYSLEDEA